MLSFSRRALLFALAFALSACSGLGGAATTPTAGEGQSPSTQNSIDRILDSAPEVTGGHMIFSPFSVHPDAKGPAWLMNFVQDGPNQGGVPCISCVNGASTNGNVGLTLPYSYVAKNYYWQYVISFSDNSYVGSCKLAWAITSGKKTIDSFSATVKLTSAGGTVLYGVPKLEKYSGPATLTGKVTCKGTSQSLQVPMQFE
jgi:hypothetical protein